MSLESAILFQFHKGTIKTAALLYSGKGANLFQFHKGTIKTLPMFVLSLSDWTCRLYFNSIKVQLRLLSNGAMFVNILFQFHKGTIKTVGSFMRGVRVMYLEPYN